MSAGEWGSSSSAQGEVKAQVVHDFNQRKRSGVRVSGWCLAGLAEGCDAVDTDFFESELRTGVKSLRSGCSSGSTVAAAWGLRHIIGSHV
jgi:hypothetical protein